jgi:hypothetical protein
MGISARSYEPTTGRFISLDPVLSSGDPRSWNGYAYANNSPSTSSDPSARFLFADIDRCCRWDAGGEAIYHAEVAVHPVRLQNPAAAGELGVCVARSYSVMSPPRAGRGLIRW